jgi:hypothetical protein
MSSPACMQVKKRLKGLKGTHIVDAASWTKEEFHSHMLKITEIAQAKLQHHSEGPIFIYDNPHNHNMTSEQLFACHLGKGTVIRPPRYSGDFMQCIEHVHGYVCAAYLKDYYRAGVKGYNVDVEQDRLRKVFFEKVTADGIALNCIKLMKLVKRVRDDGNGGYAPPDLT